MKILTGLLLREFGKMFCIALTALVAIFYIVDIFDRIEIFVMYKGPLLLKFSYFLFKIPHVMYQVVPVALLISVVTVLGLMAQNSEITALKAGGVNLYAFTLPLIIVCAFISLLVFINNEYLVPVTIQRSTEILNVKIKGKPPRGIFKQSRIWYAGADGSIFNIQTLDPKKGVLEGVTLYRFDDKYRLVERLDARKAFPTPGGWKFQNTVRRFFTDDGMRLAGVSTEDIVNLPLKETLEDLYRLKRDPEAMNFRQLARYVERLESSGFSAVAYRVDLIAKTAIPSISLLVAFMSISLALSGESRSIVARIGLCTALVFAFWLIFSLAMSLGRAGQIHPLMGAWGAGLIFGSLGMWLYANIRR